MLNNDKRYIDPVDVWKLTDSECEELQVGQVVYAGEPNNKGIWCGMKTVVRPNGRKVYGSKVVAWQGNWKNRSDMTFRQYVNTLIAYARG